MIVVRANAKIHILKQFTTLCKVVVVLFELYVLMQRYTFWSNSQHMPTEPTDVDVVRANAKIHILKQFTTRVHRHHCYQLLYVLMQRYTFWSNSQLVKLSGLVLVVVRANAKIHILKQFTTLVGGVLTAPSLYVLMQRYTFWSNSQHTWNLEERSYGCTC